MIRQQTRADLPLLILQTGWVGGWAWVPSASSPPSPSLTQAGQGRVGGTGGLGVGDRDRDWRAGGRQGG